MATQQITSPPLLDETGKEIKNALQQLAQNVKPDATNIKIGPTSSTTVAGKFSQTDQALAKVDSQVNETTDILQSALACTATTFFKSSDASSYTGTLPSAAYKVGTFTVNLRGSGRIVTATNSDGGVATNYYDGSSWGGWKELAKQSSLDATNQALSTQQAFAYGLLSASIPHVVSNVDANNYKDPGTYYFTTGCSNIPGTYFLCTVINHTGGDFVIQLGMRAAEKYRYFFRVFASNAWGDWSEFALKSGIITETVALPNSTAIPANTVKSFTFDVSKSGYTPLGIVGFTGNGTSGIVVQEFYITQNNASVYVRNATSNSLTPSSLQLRVLYKKD